MNNTYNVNDKQDAESALLTAAILSDLHLDDEADDALLQDALDNISKMDNVSTLIIPGDINNGPQKGSGEASLNRKKAIFDIFAKHFPEKYHQNVMVILGNHDIRWYDAAKDIDPETLAYYKDTIKTTFSTTLNEGTNCFDKTIGGYYFICLNSDDGEKDEIYLSETSFKWLESKITDYATANPDKPFFIVMHEPLHRTHWYSDSNIVKGLLAQDDQFKALFSRYPQLVLISGHIHNGFGVTEFMQRPFGTLVDAPSLTRQESGDIPDEKGTGWLMQVYADKIVFEAWNFSTNTPYAKFEQVVALPQLPVLSNRVQQLLPNLDIDKIIAGKGLLYRASQIMGREYVDNGLGEQGPAHYSVAQIFDAAAWKDIDKLRDDISAFLKQAQVAQNG
jgi:3',5'-cyclic AMP phosphodiesterase CpdA